MQAKIDHVLQLTAVFQQFVEMGQWDVAQTILSHLNNIFDGNVLNGVLIPEKAIRTHLNDEWEWEWDTPNAKVRCIKNLRNFTGASLSECKEFAEHMQRRIWQRETGYNTLNDCSPAKKMYKDW